MKAMKKTSSVSRSAKKTQLSLMVIVVIGVLVLLALLLLFTSSDRIRLFFSSASENNIVIVQSPGEQGFYAGGKLPIRWHVNTAQTGRFKTVITFEGTNLAGGQISLPVTQLESRAGVNEYTWLIPEFQDLRTVGSDFKIKVEVTLPIVPRRTSPVRASITKTPTPIKTPLVKPRQSRTPIPTATPTPSPVPTETIFAGFSKKFLVSVRLSLTLCEKAAINNNPIRCVSSSDKPLDMLARTPFTLKYSAPEGAKKCIVKRTEGVGMVAKTNVINSLDGSLDNITDFTDGEAKAARYHYQFECDYGGGINPAVFLELDIKENPLPAPVISLIIPTSGQPSSIVTLHGDFSLISFPIIVLDGNSSGLVFTVATDGRTLQFKVPDVSPGVHTFQVKGSLNGTSVQTNLVNFTVLPSATNDPNKLKVVSPNGGEVFKYGEPIKVTWIAASDIAFINSIEMVECPTSVAVESCDKVILRSGVDARKGTFTFDKVGVDEFGRGTGFADFAILIPRTYIVRLKAGSGALVDTSDRHFRIDEEKFQN